MEAILIRIPLQSLLGRKTKFFKRRLRITMPGNITVLNVAEKNDAAKNISRVLSSGHSQMVRLVLW